MQPGTSSESGTNKQLSDVQPDQKHSKIIECTNYAISEKSKHYKEQTSTFSAICVDKFCALLGILILSAAQKYVHQHSKEMFSSEHSGSRYKASLSCRRSYTVNLCDHGAILKCLIFCSHFVRSKPAYFSTRSTGTTNQENLCFLTIKKMKNDKIPVFSLLQSNVRRTSRKELSYTPQSIFPVKYLVWCGRTRYFPSLQVFANTK
uniref:Uncharacterized protein n=1 Tax=Timema tahoe TaxID=61484 RepID=A0A7R9FNX9_9NEOP|nr:unnamed protein product [Timema tahoe]